MLSLLAPSKTMDMSSIDSVCLPTVPEFIKQARKIASSVDSVDDLVGLMSVSSTIADNVRTMYQKWDTMTKPAIYAYRGDVYKGFYADTLTARDMEWAQKHLMTLSGLYGLVRPLDEISQYRLEMKTKLQVDTAETLYHFWGDQLARYADKQADGIICMLTSEEYGKPIRKFSASRLVTPIFMDHKPNGVVGPVPIYSKMMRGVMARWIIDNRADTPEALRDFRGFNYYFDATRSTANAPVFVRQKMTPLVF